MAVSTRTRFEVFKRDGFTCRYCGRTSPEVVLEIDHIMPVCEGGGDDPINLTTSCWECNRGKSGIPLTEVMTGEDPHDRAIMLLERKRQLAEYNAVLREEREQRCEDHDDLMDYWNERSRGKGMTIIDSNWLLDALRSVPVESIRNAMDIAVKNRKTKNLAYVGGIVRRWQNEHVSDDPES